MSLNNDEIIILLKNVWEEDLPIKVERDLESCLEADKQTKHNE